MVTRILKYEAALTANNTDQTLDTKSPREGQQWDVQEIYSDQDATNDYSLVLNERKLFDNIPGDQLADENNGLPVNITVRSGDDLAVTASETNGDTPTARFYAVVDETGG